MKNLILCTALFASASCAPYYVGRKPVETEPGFTATQTEQPIAEVAVAKPAEQPVDEAAGTTAGSPVGTGLSADDWGNQVAPVNVENANMPSAPVAYGFDGKPVDENTRKLHQMEGSEESRSVMITMYTDKIEENEALQNSLLIERDRVDALSAEILTLKAVGNVDMQEIKILKLDLAQQIKEREELEARLVTAQIRRLQAEKLLLEDRLKAAETTTPGGSRLGSSSVAKAGGRL